MAEIKIGEVIRFFAEPSVAAMIITEGVLKTGDTLHFTGRTTDFSLVVQSMQVDNQPVEEARTGDSVGIKVPERVRPGDLASMVTAE
ncbi:MAG: EF-Tu/IF-2/RF-3 family GTPase [bacterium]|jgi:putative protease